MRRAILRSRATPVATLGRPQIGKEQADIVIQTTENEGSEGVPRTLSGLAYWLLVGAGNGPPEVLTLDRDGEEILPVFSHEEEAEMYARLGGLGDGWRAVGSRAGGLISVLYGSHPDTQAVALDPLPTMVGEGTVGLVLLSRSRFVKGVMVRERLLRVKGQGRLSSGNEGAGERDANEDPSPGIPPGAQWDQEAPERLRASGPDPKARRRAQSR